jgi:hypothetical protein
VTGLPVKFKDGYDPAMSIVLPALAVMFAASCLWLAVRLVNRRERWAKWTLVGVVVGLPMLYVASFGPVCWLVGRQWLSPECLASLYRPVVAPAKLGPDSISNVIWWYVEIDDYGASGLHEMILACGYRDWIDGGPIGPPGTIAR